MSDALYLNATLTFHDERWAERPLATGLVDDLRAANLWLGFTHAGRLGGTLKRVAGAALAKELAGWSTSHTLAMGPDVEAESTRFMLSFSGAALQADLIVGAPHLEVRRKAILDEMTDLLARWHARVAGAGWVAYAHVAPEDQPYPQLRPPPSHKYWGFGHLLEALCAEAHERGPLGRPADARKILAADVPPVATREEHDGLTYFRWARDAADPTGILAARANHARWLANIVVDEKSRIDSWNAAGDKEVFPAARAPHPPLTFYDPPSQVGYQALVVQPDGAVDERFDEAAAWARAGQLPDGTPLVSVRLVVPIRENAFQIYERARAAGFGMVLYMDEQRRLWNPLPPGMWLPQA